MTPVLAIRGLFLQLLDPVRHPHGVGAVVRFTALGKLLGLIHTEDPQVYVLDAVSTDFENASDIYAVWFLGPYGLGRTIDMDVVMNAIFMVCDLR